jgi:SAM-dependent methyltransferase
MEYSKDEHYLLSKRDEGEAKRLNYQHEMIMRVRDANVLDTSIPKTDVSRVCDVGTGTGIWLEEVANELRSHGNMNFKFTGFDISPKQFPKTSSPRFNYVEWDMTKLVPEEYREQFDVVHVRLLLVVLTLDQYQTVVTNLVSLLKPGRYLQWDDFDYGDDVERVYPPPVQKAGQEVIDFIKSQNCSPKISAEVSKTFEWIGLEDIQVRDYIQVSYDRPDLQEGLWQWHKQLHAGGLPPIFMRSGKAKDRDEAMVFLQKYYEEVDKAWKNGTVFPMHLVTVVGRKKS